MGSITSFGNFAKVLNQILWFCMTWSTEEAWQSEIKILSNPEILKIKIKIKLKKKKKKLKSFQQSLKY